MSGFQFVTCFRINRSCKLPIYYILQNAGAEDCILAEMRQLPDSETQRGTVWGEAGHRCDQSCSNTNDSAALGAGCITGQSRLDEDEQHDSCGYY